MKAAFGAVAGALAVAAVLVSYNLGARSSFGSQMTVPTTQMLVGADGILRAYVVPSGQNGSGQPIPGAPYGVSVVAIAGRSRHWERSLPAYQHRSPIMCRRNTSRRAVVQEPVRRVYAKGATDDNRGERKKSALCCGSAGAAPAWSPVGARGCACRRSSRRRGCLLIR